MILVDFPVRKASAGTVIAVVARPMVALSLGVVGRCDGSRRSSVRIRPYGYARWSRNRCGCDFAFLGVFLLGGL